MVEAPLPKLELLEEGWGVGDGGGQLTWSSGLTGWLPRR